MAEIKEVSLINENMAKIRCPECHKSKSVDMSKYMTMDRVIIYKAKCIPDVRNGYHTFAYLTGIDDHNNLIG